MRKTLTFFVLPAAIAAFLVITSPASAITQPQVFSLLGLPQGYVPIEGFPEAGVPEVGARVVITERLHKWNGRKAGAQVGRTEVLCTVIGAGGHRPPSFCAATYSLPSGKILVAGFGPSPVGPGVKIPVVGGTGAYANARGFVRVRDLPGFKTNNEFHLLP